MPGVIGCGKMQRSGITHRSRQLNCYGMKPKNKPDTAFTAVSGLLFD